MAQVLVGYASPDQPLAEWLIQHLSTADYHVVPHPVGTDHLPHHPSTTFLAVVSAGTADDPVVTNCYATARQQYGHFIPILASFADEIPWYIQNLDIADFTLDIETAFEELLHRLPPQHEANMTFGQARDTYLQRATLKSAHTIDAYRRAIELFFGFLADRTIPRELPLQQQTYVVPDDIALNALCDQDAPLFLHFAQWLLSPGSGKTSDKRPYKASTVELRLAGLQNWFQYLDDYGWLPPTFKLAKAKRIVRDELRHRPQHSGPPQPPDHIEEVIYYYDTQPLPKHLRKPHVDPERIERWELTRTRNRALLHALAETGGRISEILSLNLDDFPVRYLERNEVLRIEVTGKGGHSYYLRFYDALPAIRAYIQARGAHLKATRGGHVPLFVSHDARYDGNRMSRVVAWRVVQRAARALGVKDVTPHDFRHWRATQLINAGHALDVVQEYLGHRSVETTRAYYAHTDPLRVDDAAKHTGLPDPEDLLP